MTERRLFQIVAWLTLGAIGVLSLASPSFRPTILPHNLEHAAIFALAGGAVGLGYPRRSALHMGALVLFAAVIEIAQFYAPGRHARLIDFVVDAAAACIGVGIALALNRLRGRMAGGS